MNQLTFRKRDIWYWKEYINLFGSVVQTREEKGTVKIDTFVKANN